MQKKLYGFLSLFVLFISTSVVHSQPPGKVVDVEAIKPGKYYALLFAVNDYENGIKPLSNPIEEQTALKEVLEKHYGFEVTLVENATRDDYYDQIDAMKKKITENDNLLIAYSGHGIWKENRGYWQMKDAEEDSRRTWLENSTVKGDVSYIKCKHLLLMIDACFGGSIFKSTRGTLSAREKSAKDSYLLKSKTAMTSGNMTTVPDNSIFMKRLIAEMEQNDAHYLSASQLFVDIEGDVVANNPKGVRPIYNFIADAGSIGGDFIFIRESAAPKPKISEAELAKRAAQKEDSVWNSALISDKKAAYAAYLQTYPSGKHSVNAREAITRLNASKKVADLPKKTGSLTIPLGIGVDMKLIFIEGGTFTMGCTEEQGGDCDGDEKPTHEVSLSGFYLGETEVTNIQYCIFLNEMGNQKEGRATWIKLESYNCGVEKVKKEYIPKSGMGQHPVNNVSWYGARAYCKWLSKKTGREVRLPTEAQWEYAARGGNGSENYKYAGSNDVDEVAWYMTTANDSDTKAVATKKANELGLYDMSGNVWEWCSDWYGDYNGSAQTDPEGPESGSGRVGRGGSCDSKAKHCRSAIRNSSDLVHGNHYTGFRLAVRP